MFIIEKLEFKKKRNIDIMCLDEKIRKQRDPKFMLHKVNW